VTRLYQRVLMRDLAAFLAAGWTHDGRLYWIESLREYEAIVERAA
jgi:hypothetical protein